MSDRTLAHASYLARLSGAELIVMHVLDTEVIPPSAVLTFIKPEPGATEKGIEEAKQNLWQSFENTATKMLKERTKIATSSMGSMDDRRTRMAYIIRNGKPVDEIVRESEGGNYDLIVMASSRIESKVRVIGSTARRILDSASKPVLMAHE